MPAGCSEENRLDIVMLLRGSAATEHSEAEAEATSRWRGASLTGKCSLSYMPALLSPLAAAPASAAGRVASMRDGPGHAATRLR